MKFLNIVIKLLILTTIYCNLKLKKLTQDFLDLKAPKLSECLNERDPSKKVRLQEFVTLIRPPLYNLTKGELEQIFVFADASHDDLIDSHEWESFVQFFIRPFEICDKNNDYLLDLEEYKECFDKDIKSKLIQFEKKYEDKKYELMMGIVSSRKSLDINVADFLFIKRSLFAWQECQSSQQYIAKSHFKCAIRIAIPQKYHLKVTFDNIYDVGVVIANDPGHNRLDFISYLRIMYTSYVFTVFGSPYNIPFLEKTQFLKSIREDRLPNTFDEEEIELLYEITSDNPLHKATQLNFNSFAFFYNLNKLFNRYSSEKTSHLKDTELINLLNDPLIPTSILNAIDKSFANFTSKEYDYASSYIQSLKLSERDFYFSFKQKQIFNNYYIHKTQISTEEVSIPRAHMPYPEISINENSRKFFFTIMCEVDKTHWNKYSFYKAFQLSNLFVALTSDYRYIVNIETILSKMPKYYDMVNPVISISQRKNYMFYKSIPKECNLDLLTFLEIENFSHKFRIIKVSRNNFIIETMLKIVMKDYGLENLSDEVINYAGRGFDKLNRRIYDSQEVMKVLFIVQAIASENHRVNEMVKSHGVKLNPNSLFSNFPFDEK